MTICQSDAARNEDSKKAGLGWFIRSHDNQTIEKSQLSTHVLSPLMAEALALKEAVIFLLERSTTRVRFESDSSLLIKAINSDTSLLNLYGICMNTRDDMNE